MSNIVELEESARAAFAALNTAFSRFLSTTGALRDLERLPLYQVTLAFFFHLAEVASPNHWTPIIREAICDIEQEAENSAGRILAASGRTR